METTDNEGRPLVVTGVVFVPADDPPEGGWPVVTLGHGSVGINQECAPSLNGNLSGMSPSVLTYLNRGLAVTVADFPGLGSASGRHRYLDSYAAARSMIDSVRAVRTVYPNVSSRWLAYGISQGGGAVWAATEIAASYAPELQLLGAAAQVPSTDRAGLVDRAIDGTLTIEQQGIFQWLLESLARHSPALDLDEMRTPQLRAAWGQLSLCGGDSARDPALQTITADGFYPRSQATIDYLRDLLEPMSPPHRRSTAPLLVTYGGDDRFVDAAGTKTAIAQAYETGSAVSIDYQSTAGHLTVVTSKIWPFLTRRLASCSERQARPAR